MNLFQLLTSLAPLTALIGQSVFPMVLPTEGTHPALTYQIVSSVNLGVGVDNGGLTKLRLQCDAFAPDYGAANAVRAALIAALDGYTGQVGQTFVQNALSITSRDAYENQIELYRLSAEFYLFF